MRSILFKIGLNTSGHVKDPTYLLWHAQAANIELQDWVPQEYLGELDEAEQIICQKCTSISKTNHCHCVVGLEKEKALVLDRIHNLGQNWNATARNSLMELEGS